MRFTVQTGFVGETVRIRATGQLGIIVSDNADTERHFAQRRVVLKALDGRELQYSMLDIEMFLPAEETIAFRTVMRTKYPALYII